MILKETWFFFATEPKSFMRNLGGISKKGTYEVADGILKIQETASFSSTNKMPSDKKWDYKYKLTTLGYEYIHEANGKKLLYNCWWMGTSNK